jgi:hypothetical protein
MDKRSILALMTASITMIMSGHLILANANASNEWNNSCYDAGYDDGQNNPFNRDTYDHCADEDGGDQAYYDGFIDGCMSVEGNTRDVCESATDA